MAFWRIARSEDLTTPESPSDLKRDGAAVEICHGWIFKGRCCCRRSLRPPSLLARAKIEAADGEEDEVTILLCRCCLIYVGAEFCLDLRWAHQICGRRPPILSDLLLLSRIWGKNGHARFVS
ncbi:hypothetical protein ACLOJK_018465 [Asimina triloba]